MKTIKIIFATILVCISGLQAYFAAYLNHQEAKQGWLFSLLISIILLIVFVTQKPKKSR